MSKKEDQKAHGSWLHHIKLIALSVLAVYSAFTFIFMLALQQDQPFTTEPPKGRCDSLFTSVLTLQDEQPDVVSSDIFAYRYVAGKSQLMVCTDINETWYQEQLGSHATPFFPWESQAVDNWYGCTGLNYTKWTEDNRITTTTPIYMDDGFTLMDPQPTNETAYLIEPIPNGGCWKYFLTQNASFRSPTCGANGTGVGLEPNKLPSCNKTGVLAFHYVSAHLVTYYQVILICIFVPHLYYIYACIRFWCHVGGDNEKALYFFEHGDKGFGAIFFLAFMMFAKCTEKICSCCEGESKLDKLWDFIETYVEAEHPLQTAKPPSLPVFCLDSFAAFAEFSFLGISLFGCKPVDIKTKYPLMIVLGQLVKSVAMWLFTIFKYWKARRAYKSKQGQNNVGEVLSQRMTSELNSNVGDYENFKDTNQDQV